MKMKLMGFLFYAFFLHAVCFADVHIDTLDPVPAVKVICEIKFPNAKVGLVRAGEGRIFESIGSRTDWSELPFKVSDILNLADSSARLTAFSNVITFFDEQTGYIGCPAGKIMKTIDSGVTWTELTTGSSEQITSISPVDTNMVFAVDESGTIHVTVNGGETWNKVTKSPFSIIHFQDDSIGMVPKQNKLYLSKDTGKTWDSAALEEKIRSMYFIDDSTGYIIGQTKQWKTGNGGITWTPETAVYRGYINPNNGWPLNNGSVKWFFNDSSGTVGYNIEYLPDLQFRPDSINSYATQPARYAKSEDCDWAGVIYNDNKSSDACWKNYIFPRRWAGPYSKYDKNTFLYDKNYLLLSFKDSLRGISIVDSQIFVTTNGGDVWKSIGKVNLVAENRINSINRLNDSTVFFNAGSKVIKCAIPSLDVKKVVLTDIDSTNLFCCFVNYQCGFLIGKSRDDTSQTIEFGNNDKLPPVMGYRTDDQGETWNEVAIDLPPPIRSVTVLNGKLFVLSDSVLSCSHDTGKTFVNLQAPHTPYTSVQIMNDSVFILKDERYNYGEITFYKTINAGTTWSTIPIRSDNLYRANVIQGLFLDDKRGFMSIAYSNSGDHLLFFTDDAWSQQWHLILRLGDYPSMQQTSSNTTIITSSPFGCFRITADPLIPIGIGRKEHPPARSKAKNDLHVVYNSTTSTITIGNWHGEKGVVSIFNIRGQLLFKKNIVSTNDRSFNLTPTCVENILVYRFVSGKEKMVHGRLLILK